MFGTPIARSKMAYWVLNPHFSAPLVTPTIALVPLVLVWFGFTGRVLFVVLAAVVPILFSVASGLRDAPGDRRHALLHHELPAQLLDEAEVDQRLAIGGLLGQGRPAGHLAQTIGQLLQTIDLPQVSGAGIARAPKPANGLGETGDSVRLTGRVRIPEHRDRPCRSSVPACSDGR